MSKDNTRIRRFVKRFVNPILRNVTGLSFGPFALIRHVGRKSGKTYEIPIMVWRVPDGFIIVLTYGPEVDWLRNPQAADQGTLRWHKKEYMFQAPVFVDATIARPALPALIKIALRLKGTFEYVKLTDQSFV